MLDGYENAPQSTEVGRRIQRFEKDMLGNDIPLNNPPQKIADGSRYAAGVRRRMVPFNPRLRYGEDHLARELNGDRREAWCA